MHMNQEGKEYTNHPERYSFCASNRDKQDNLSKVGMNYSLKERTSGHVSPTKNQRSFAKYILPDDNSYCNDYMVSCNRYQAQNESYGLVTNITSNPCIFHTKAQGLDNRPASSSSDATNFTAVDKKEEEIVCSSQFVQPHSQFKDYSFPHDNRVTHLPNSCYKDSSLCSSKFSTQSPSYPNLSQPVNETHYSCPINAKGLSNNPYKRIYPKSRESFLPISYPPAHPNNRENEFFPLQSRMDVSSTNHPAQPLAYPSYSKHSYSMNKFYSKPDSITSIPMNEVSTAESLTVPPCYEMEKYTRSSYKQKSTHDNDGSLYDSKCLQTIISSSTYLTLASDSRTIPSTSEPLPPPPPSSEPISMNPLLKPYPNEVDLRKLQSGEETRTCVMIRNIPNKYRREDVVHLLYSIVNDHFSVTSFPLDMTTGRNLGYCFVRFDTVADLIKAYNKLAYLSWPNSDSVKTCRFCFAREQSTPPPHVILANKNRSNNQNEKKHSSSYAKH